MIARAAGRHAELSGIEAASAIKPPSRVPSVRSVKAGCLSVKAGCLESWSLELWSLELWM